MWSVNGDGERSYQIDHILVKRKELKRSTDCDTITGAKGNHTAIAAIIQIASFIPRKQKQNHHQAEPQGSQMTKEEK
jgi:hypothetical protein